MASLYTYGDTLTPFETAKSGEVANELRAIQSAFEALDLLMSRFLAVTEAVPTIPQDAAARALKNCTFDASGNPVATVDVNTGDLAFPIPISQGGTGADSAPAALANLGAVPITRTIGAGAGLTGGRDLSANVLLVVGQGSGITVNTNDVALDASDPRNADHSAISISAGAGLTGSGPIDANVSLAVGAGLGITVNANDVQLTTTHPRNVDHSAISITAGVGLAGGGTIDDDVTLSLSLNGLTTITAVDGTNDRLGIADASDSNATRNVAPNNLIGNNTDIGYRDLPLTTHDANYTFALGDRGRDINHTSASTHTWTIPANADVAFPLGTVIGLGAANGSGDVSIAPDSGVTLRWAGPGTSGARTLAANAQAYLKKTATNTWYVGGAGIT